MSIADQIYEANGVGQVEPLDELVKKALEASVEQRHDDNTVYQLHLRGDGVYYGNSLVPETDRMVYMLTGVTERIPPPLLVLFWAALKKRLPVLDRSVFQVSDHLFWDREKGELVRRDEWAQRGGDIE